MDRVLVGFGGLFGALGVALSAAAAHRGGVNLGTAASMLLAHAPALLAIGLLGANRVARIGAGILLVGVVLFAGDLLAREFLGDRLFPYAAPAGGMLMIGGWAVVALSAFAGRGQAGR
jgi:uncharacterized membrane protein YgdD (TMEM256/DUF423 family)